MTIIYINSQSQFQEVNDREAMRLVLSGQAQLVHQDAELSYQYAREVLGRPWPPGEAAIATAPELSHCYARFVICRPWLPGEPAIRSEPYWWARYQEFVKSCQ